MLRKPKTLKRLRRQSDDYDRMKSFACALTKCQRATHAVTYTRTEGQCLGMWFFGFGTGVLFMFLIIKVMHMAGIL